MAILKLLHVFFVFIWIGTLLTQTRFLGYLVKEIPSIQERIMKIVKKVYFLVDLPAMLLTIATGIVLLLFKEDINWKAPWLHIKLTLVFLLIICDLITGKVITKHARTLLQGKQAGYLILHTLIALILVAAIL